MLAHLRGGETDVSEKTLEGVTISIVGDILHSRVARSNLVRIGFATLLTALSGCSAARPRSSLEEATVTGTVKVRGKLLDGGELNFSAVNPNRRVEMRKATIGKDGTYTAKAYIGLNTVTVFPRKPKNKKEGKDFFGVNYDEKSVTVKSGENTADLEFLP